MEARRHRACGAQVPVTSAPTRARAGRAQLNRRVAVMCTVLATCATVQERPEQGLRAPCRAAGVRKGRTMPTATATSLDMRGKTITTFIAYAAARRLAEMAQGQTLELLTDAGDAIDNDIRAWCRATEQELSSAARGDGTCRYTIAPPSSPPPPGRRLAAVISDPGLQELLSPLGFALAAALEGTVVSLYFQGPAVRVLAKGFTEKLHGPGRPFSRFARAGLAQAGHIAAQEKIGQLQTLGAHLYICGPSMQHFKVAKTDLAFGDVTIAEYLTFMEIMANADIHLFVQ